ncbi:TRAM domain-containing protein [Nesterenkonia halobia]|uniref:TRAM domain-containing protein n=2 Tax=Nesterenkonia halobia TaxID=37922 RepID=A0ABP6REM7_9MICC
MTMMTTTQDLTGRILTLDVGPMAHGGHCIARHEGRVIFVRHAIPGEVVRAKLTDAGPQAKFWRADVVEVVDGSDYRRRHIWKLADSLRAHEMERLPVGGAEFGHITDQHQRRLKAQVFRDTLQRIGGISAQDAAMCQDPADGEIHVSDIGTPHSNGLHWRTRVTFGVDEHGSLAMKPHRSHDLIELRGMPLAVEAIHESTLFSADFSGARRVEAVAPGGAEPVALVVHADAERAADGALAERMRRLAAADSRIGSIVLALARTEAPPRRRGRGARRGRAPAPSTVVEHETVVGSPTVEEPLPTPVAGPEGVRSTVAVRPEGFWQIHRHAPQALVRTVADLAQVEPGDAVADLYAGAGLFTAWAAEAVGPQGSVLSVEGARSSSSSAAELFAGSQTVTVRRAAVEAALDALSGSDVVLLDPPRAGAGRDVVAGLDDAGPRRVVYVACEPASFARDAKDLLARGWRMRRLQVLDLYPNTHHMESVAVFER